MGDCKQNQGIVTPNADRIIQLSSRPDETAGSR
jgi:hypothetical protein